MVCKTIEEFIVREEYLNSKMKELEKSPEVYIKVDVDEKDNITPDGSGEYLLDMDLTDLQRALDCTHYYCK